MRANLQDVSTSVGLLVLRVGVGTYMATHGWGKVGMLTADEVKFGDPIGLGPVPSLVLVTFAEFVCALLLVIGLATRFAAIPIVIAMGVAAFVAHGNDPWTMQREGASKEPAMLFLIPALALAFTGAGRFSIDAVIGARRAAT